MLTMSDSVCVDAPAAVVWAALSELEAIHLWSESIRRSSCPGEHARGVNAVRVCELGGNVTVTETVTEWEEGVSFTYIGEGIPLVKRAKNRWSVEALGARTLVTSSSEVEVRGGVFGRLLEPAVRIMSKRLARRSLAPFKYFAETGKPHEGRARKLAPAPSGC